MRAGRLNKQVILQRREQARDENFNVVTVWSEVAITWARREDLSVRELEAARSSYPDASVRFLMRYRTDVVHGMRIQLKSTGESFDVVGAMDRKGSTDELQVICAKVKPNVQG